MNKPAADNRSALLDVVNLEEDTGKVEIDADQYPEHQVGPDKKITLQFSLALAARPDALIDSNFDKAAVSFVIGDGNLLPAFEEVMFGMQAGDEEKFIIPALQAFGLRNEDNIHLYPRYQFPADLLMEKGLMINFSDVGGNEQAGVISDFNAEQVFVDFNHPLADQDILFTVAIKAVEPKGRS
tara:strand:+ start:4109 stop:4657 length:549 start_codon:yes stop_codon:yes gene_type:complete